MKIFGNLQFWQGSSQYGNVNSDGSSSIGGGSLFVDRGDIGACDWTSGSFTKDATWRDLDCSAIVPANAKFIQFDVHLVAPSVGTFFGLRKKGYTGGYSYTGVYVPSNGAACQQQLLVPCDSSRFVQYYVVNTTYTNIDVKVTGWIL